MDLSTFTLDTAPIITLAGQILMGLGTIWGLRKIIKLMNRS